MFDSELKFLGEIRWQSLLGFSNKSVSFSQLVSQSVSLGLLDKNTAQLISIVSPFFRGLQSGYIYGVKDRALFIACGGEGKGVGRFWLCVSPQLYLPVSLTRLCRILIIPLYWLSIFTAPPPLNSVGDDWSLVPLEKPCDLP